MYHRLLLAMLVTGIFSGAHGMQSQNSFTFVMDDDVMNGLQTIGVDPSTLTIAISDIRNIKRIEDSYCILYHANLRNGNSLEAKFFIHGSEKNSYHCSQTMYGLRWDNGWMDDWSTKPLEHASSYFRLLQILYLKQTITADMLQEK